MLLWQPTGNFLLEMGYDIALGFSEIVMITVRLKYFLVLGKIQPDKIRVAENESMQSSSDFSYHESDDQNGS